MQELNKKEIEKIGELFNSLLDSIVTDKNSSQIKKIADVAIINPPKPKFNEWDLEREVDFLPMSVLAKDVPNPFPAQRKKIKEVLKGYTCFQSDDILLAKITPCFENGKTGIFRKNPVGIGFGSTEFIVIRVDQKQVFPLWVWLFVFSNKFRHEGALRMTGSAGQKRIPVSFVENYQIPVPSLHVQQQILDKFQVIGDQNNTCKKKKVLLNELFESTLNKLMKPN
jgi:restriction endonuclease S subunit